MNEKRDPLGVVYDKCGRCGHFHARNTAASVTVELGVDYDACWCCGRPFDPDDTRADGSARHACGRFCRSCVDRCHESTDAFHVCQVCK